MCFSGSGVFQGSVTVFLRIWIWFFSDFGPATFRDWFFRLDLDLVFQDSDWFLLRILDLNFQRNIGSNFVFQGFGFRLSKVAKKKLTDIGFGFFRKYWISGWFFFRILF